MNLNRIPAYIKAGEKCLKEFPTVNMGDRDSIYMDTIIVYYSLN